MERSCGGLRIAVSKNVFVKCCHTRFWKQVYPCLYGLVRWLFDGYSMTPIGPWDWSALWTTYTHTVTTELYKLISQWPHNEPALFRLKSILHRDGFKWMVTKSDDLVIPISVARVCKSVIGDVIWKPNCAQNETRNHVRLIANSWLKVFNRCEAYVMLGCDAVHYGVAEVLTCCVVSSEDQKLFLLKFSTWREFGNVINHLPRCTVLET
jgi:hypothetical protein